MWGRFICTLTVLVCNISVLQGRTSYASFLAWKLAFEFPLFKQKFNDTRVWLKPPRAKWITYLNSYLYFIFGLWRVLFLPSQWYIYKGTFVNVVLACYLFLVGGLLWVSGSALLIEIEVTKVYCFPLLFPGASLSFAPGFWLWIPGSASDPWVFCSGFICFRLYLQTIKNPFYCWYWWSFIASLADAVSCTLSLLLLSGKAGEWNLGRGKE